MQVASIFPRSFGEASTEPGPFRPIPKIVWTADAIQNAEEVEEDLTTRIDDDFLECRCRGGGKRNFVECVDFLRFQTLGKVTDAVARFSCLDALNQSLGLLFHYPVQFKKERQPCFIIDHLQPLVTENLKSTQRL